ncbi:DUF4363 family protein [Ornithinibacillus bavariensis]|uniref:DUF4363 family protein n=1 Tax=Ornithinibacillus bavariensis TaxID=545502 RepID=A0A919X7D4_9BACI|nr:DUF4363 family protein [Ornithinibacillus bavariensis]GIO25905.1 hypothetical protein J43TS3_05160 [Ornithinibacillus bavariensis]HAM79695.1 hypothetical protein [Ornithinibacillus sp.]
MLKRIFILCSLLLCITACNDPIAGQPFFDRITAMEKSIKEEEWEISKKQWKEFNSHYKDNTWKLQLIGDENEYEGVHESLLRLEAAINQHDSTQALIELANIKAYLEQIYSM